MYRCSNCGAGMRYDISSKKLKCDYCGSDCPVDDHPLQQAEARRDDYEVMVFSCPQCGGQIRSTDNAATDFCSYCGASVVLEGKLVNEKKPAYIIPFSRTKKECKEIFSQCVQKAWCVLDAYKDPEKLDKFTGIYMPYWVYDVSQHAEPTLKGSRRDGNYVEHCNLSFKIDHNYKYISYDAAAGFSDDLSDVINNYSREDIKDFNSAYLSGFYADSPDVREKTYMEEAANASCDMTMAAVRKEYPGVTIQKVEDPVSEFNAMVENVKEALFPVWFLTWRDKNRVSYAVINGQTAKTAADLPVSLPKFLLFSVLFALPFSVLFYLLPSIHPATTLGIYLVAGIWAILQNNSIAKTYISREAHLTDKGLLLSTESGRKQWNADLERKKAKEAEEKRKREERSKKSKSGSCAVIMIFFISTFVMIFITALLEAYADTLENFLRLLLEYAVPGTAIILSVVILHKLYRKSAQYDLIRTILPDTLFLSVTVAAASVVLLMHPVEDLLYYIASLTVFAGIMIGYLGIFRRFNLSCTRPIPNYHERGNR